MIKDSFSSCEGPKLNPERVIRDIYDERDIIQNKHMFLKRVVLWYVMLCYHMLWYGMESMVCHDISMLSYAIVSVVKDKHSATVITILHL